MASIIATSTSCRFRKNRQRFSKARLLYQHCNTSLLGGKHQNNPQFSFMLVCPLSTPVSISLMCYVIKISLFFLCFSGQSGKNLGAFGGNKEKQRGISECFLFFKNTINHLPVSHLLGQTSGTTVTFVVVDQWTVTVACVGDSRCVLDPRGGVVSALTVDHRLEENEEE